MGEPSKLPKWILFLGAVVVLFWVGFFFCTNEDRFESLSALFSGLAFVGLIGTLIYQRQELSQQKQELENTRVVLNETAQANKDSVNISHKNLRAQYIIFWLQQNTDIYRKAAINWEQYSLYAELLEKQHNILTRDDVLKLTNDTVVITLPTRDKEVRLNNRIQFNKLDLMKKIELIEVYKQYILYECELNKLTTDIKEKIQRCGETEKEL